MRFLLIFSILFLTNYSLWSQPLPKVEFQTPPGKIVVEIDTVHAPVTAKNFLEHVENGTFKNAVFYRTVRKDNQPNNDIKIEVIQGGLYSDAEIEKHPGIQHETTKETGLKHLDGTISMARNEPGTASTEFFICMGSQPELDFGGKRNSDGQGFAAFGKVLNGMDVVRKIQQLPDENQYLKEPVKIHSIKMIQ
ncbi:peptidylprolyl isomerase [Mariniphaga sp.]|uniref:peptidylprolyl isomerase n=1 Tax=Mariniphaga sp. TaxID=1954475 RepID=UPI003567A758